jgi:uncharacterized protein
MVLRGVITGLSLALVATVAQGQDWITPDACAVSPATYEAALASSANEASLAAADDLAANGHGRLWEVTSPDGETSHLWATMHSSDRLILDLPPELEALIPKARMLLVENDQLAPSRTVLEQRNLQAGVWIAPSDPAYKRDYFDRRVLDWVEARVEGVLGNADLMLKLSDAGLAWMLLSDPCEDFAAGILPIQDHRLYLAAYEAGVPVKGLENWDAFLTEISQADRRKTAQAIGEIYGAYLNPEGFSEARAASFALYRQGRIGEMIAGDRAFLDDFFGRAKAGQLAALANGYLIAERNTRFLRAMRRHLDTGGALVAVGAFHLPGDDGLIALLRGQGYKVTRLVVAGEAP